jgi:hypothetical protein
MSARRTLGPAAARLDLLLLRDRVVDRDRIDARAYRALAVERVDLPVRPPELGAEPLLRSLDIGATLTFEAPARFSRCACHIGGRTGYIYVIYAVPAAPTIFRLVG